MKQLLILLLSFLFFTVPIRATDYYASASGSGSTCTIGSPCLIASVWALMVAGDTLNLNDGTYTGADSMIDPPAAFDGTVGSRMTIQAINDGEVTINGEGAR